MIDIKRFIVTQSLRINSGTKPEFTTDDFVDAALKRFNDGKRWRYAQSRNKPKVLEKDDDKAAFTELVERAKAMLQSKGVEVPDEEW